MKRRKRFLLAGLVVALALTPPACSGGDDEEGATETEAATTETTEQAADQVTLQLKSVPQAQFAGYYAALDQRYYEEAGLDVTIEPGTPDIPPAQVVASGQAELGIDWLPALLAAREDGSDLINIAQVFARGGMLEVTWKNSGIKDVAGLRGKKVGAWCCGYELELFAALAEKGIDPNDKADVTIVDQPFDMRLFVERQVDAAAALTYNELAQVLEQENPKTGKPYRLADLKVISMEDVGTAALEDGIFVRGDWLADEANQDVAKRFLRASFRGWIFCRDNQVDCLRIVLDAGPTLGEGHQRWQLNEVNALIWPSEDRIGIMDAEDFERTSEMALRFGVIDKEASDDAYRTDLADAALTEITDDTNGADWKKETVEVTPGGE
jgi:NitT/TauT family transport system substrate-binding protein